MTFNADAVQVIVREKRPDKGRLMALCVDEDPALTRVKVESWIPAKWQIRYFRMALALSRFTRAVSARLKSVRRSSSTSEI